MRHGWAAVLAASALLLAGSALAVTTGAGATTAPQGEPRATEELRDGDFGVVRRGFALQRRVEMYQWSAGDEGFRRVWNPAPIDSSGFPTDHQNPPEVPLESRRWWSSEATLDGRPIDVEVLRRLGDWEQFRPGFSRLPGNLAATFQPDGDGLSSSINPLDPQIGDLRVTWHELELPPLAGKVELRDGRWQLAPRRGPADEASRPEASRLDSVEPRANGESHGDGGDAVPAWVWWLVIAVAAALAVFGRRTRGRR